MSHVSLHLCWSFSSLSSVISPSIILPFPSFRALRLWLNFCPGCQFSTVMMRGYFRVERGCSPLHGEHVISLSLYDRRIWVAQWLARCEIENLQCWCITLKICVRVRGGERNRKKKQEDRNMEVAFYAEVWLVFLGTCPVSGPVRRWVCQGSGWTSRWVQSSAPPAMSSPAAAPGHGGTAAGNLEKHEKCTFVVKGPRWFTPDLTIIIALESTPNNHH